MSETMTQAAAVIVMAAAAAVVIGNTTAVLLGHLRRQQEEPKRRGDMTVWMIEKKDEVIFTHDLKVLRPGDFIARRLTVIGDAVLDEDGRPVRDDRIARRARLGAFGLVIVPRELW